MDISRLLRAKANEVTITERELFTSKPFHRYISKMVEGLTERWTNPPGINLEEEGQRGAVAYTNGSCIHLNLTNSLLSHVTGTLRKFKVLLGILFHEVAHILYLDFAGEKEQLARLEKGELPGNGPFTSIEADEIRAALKKPGYVDFFQELYHKLSNFAADNHDEEAIIASNKWASSEGKQSLVEECIRGARAVLKTTSPTVETLLARSEGKITVSLMTSLLFQYIRHGVVIVEDMDTMECEAVKALEDYKADANLIATTDDTMERYDGITRIVLRLWPIIKAQTNPPQQQQGSQGQQGQESQDQGDQQSQGSQGQGGQSEGRQSSSDGTGAQSEEQQPSGSEPQSGEPSLDQILEDIKDAAQDQGESQCPQNRTNSKAVKSQPQQPQQSAQSGGQGSKGGESDQLNQGGADGDSQQPSGGSTEETDASSNENDVNGQQSQGSQGENADQADDSTASPSDTGDGGKATDESTQGQDGNQPQGQNTSNPSDKTSQDNKIQGEKQESADKAMTDAGKSDGGDGDPDQHESMAKERLKQILDDVRRAKATAQCERELSQQSAAEVKTVNAAGPHSHIPCHVQRIGWPTQDAIKSHQKAYAEVKSYSQRLQRMVKQELEERERGVVLRHRAFGKSIDVRDAYRPDQQFFVNKKQPDDPTEMAVCLLVDLSGSMCGERITAAKKAATLLYDFCQGLHIPCMVCGHNTTAHFTFTIASMFDSVDGMDKARIWDMNCSSCNRDGMAVEIAAGLLSKRQEEHKLLVVLSDGQPNDTNYGGIEAVRDIQSIVSKYRRRGVETIGTAIGDDRDRIRQIYGDGYLDIQDLSKLPTMLTKLLKNKFLK